jgi:hypothetical protein
MQGRKEGPIREETKLKDGEELFYNKGYILRISMEN